MPSNTYTATPDGNGLSVFARKLDLLFRTRLCPVSKQQHARDIAISDDPTAPQRMVEYSYGAVAKAIGSTSSYIHQMRSGRRDNPGLKYVQRLAEFFRVDIAYLAKDDIPVDHLPQYLIEQRTLAHRLNTLFDKVRSQPGAPPYTNEQVAAAINTRPEQIQHLRDGTLDDPGLRLLQSLASFFHVPTGYLADPDAALAGRIDKELDLLTNWIPVAARGSLVSPENLELLAKLLQHVRELDVPQVDGVVPDEQQP